MIEEKFCSGKWQVFCPFIQGRVKVYLQIEEGKENKKLSPSRFTCHPEDIFSCPGSLNII